MRFESATVPAAVMPDRFNDDGYLKYLPLFRCYCRDGKASENRDKSEDLPDKTIFKAFGKKSAGSSNDSLLNLLSAPNNGYHIK